MVNLVKSDTINPFYQSPGGAVVNLVDREQITPFYQLPLSVATEYKKAFLSIEVGCGTWGNNGSTLGAS